MDSRPIVSVIIPVYNREELIHETLDSLIAQTYIKWEAVVVDNGSSDNTISIVEDYMRRESRVKLFFQHEVKGAPAARNLGIKKAIGKYIMFLDSDDVLSNTCLAERVSFFDQNDSCDFVIFNGKIFKDIAEDTDVLLSYNAEGLEKDESKRFLNLDPSWGTAGALWKKSIFAEKFFYWNEQSKGYQDIEFHLRALFGGFKYLKSYASPNYYWRFHEFGNLGKKLGEYDYLTSHLNTFTSIYNTLSGENKTKYYFEFRNLMMFFVLNPAFNRNQEKAIELLNELNKSFEFRNGEYAKTKLMLQLRDTGGKVISKGLNYLTFRYYLKDIMSLKRYYLMSYNEAGERLKKKS